MTRKGKNKVRFFDNNDTGQLLLKLSIGNPIIADAIDSYIADDDKSFNDLLMFIILGMDQHIGILIKELHNSGKKVKYEPRYKGTTIVQ